MNTGLLTELDMAERFGEKPAKILEWRRVYDWPHVRVGRKFRWTEEQYESIVRSHTVAGTDPKASKDPRTARSARRSK